MLPLASTTVLLHFQIGLNLYVISKWILWELEVPWWPLLASKVEPTPWMNVDELVGTCVSRPVGKRHKYKWVRDRRKWLSTLPQRPSTYICSHMVGWKSPLHLDTPDVWIILCAIKNSPLWWDGPTCPKNTQKELTLFILNFECIMYHVIGLSFKK